MVAFLILFTIIDRAPIFHSPLFGALNVVFVFSRVTILHLKKRLQTRKVWTTFSKQTRLRRPRRHRNSPIKTNRTISSPRVRLFAPLNTHCTSFLVSNSLFRLNLPFLFSLTYARVLFLLRRRNGRICFRATTRFRECRSAIGTEQRRFYSRKRDWHASSTTTDDDNERLERKFPPAATTTTTRKSRANGTRDVTREHSFGAFRSFYRSRLGF